MIRKLSGALACGVCVLAIASPASAQERRFDIPPGGLDAGLDAFSRQSGLPVIYKADDVAGARSPGVRGSLPAEAALGALLGGTQFTFRTDSSGAIAIVRKASKPEASDQRRPEARSAGNRENATAMESALEEIVVTAQRREESAQKVPISMTVLSPEAMSRIQTGNDIGQLVPNVQIEQGNGFGIPRTGIRGIAQGDFNPNATTSNMMYIDDVPLNAAIAQGVVIWDLGRAEVLRGPQGTLFGRNATGGAIRYIAAMPTSEWEGYADFTVGRFGQTQANAAAGGPLSDTFGLRVSYTGNRTDGDVYNILRQERQGKQSYYGVRGVFDWRPNEVLTAVLRAQYFESHVQPIPWKSTPGLATRPGFGPLPDGRTVADLQAAYGYRNLGYTSNYTIFEGDGVGLEHLEHLPISLNIDLDLGSVTFTSVTGYLKVDQSFVTDSDSSPAPFLTAYYINSGRQWTQEFRLASNGDGPFKWILGAFYMHERMESLLNWDATEWRGQVVFPNANTVMYTRGQSQETESYAAFAHTTYQLTPRLMLAAAARYTKENKDILYTFRSQWDFPTDVPRTSNQFFDFKRAVETRNLGVLLSAAQAPLAGHKSWDNLSWKFALDYQVNDHVMAYALVSRGFKGGSFKPTANLRSEVLNADGTILAVRPEIVTDYEVGVKADVVPGRLRVNAGLYYYDFKDYQTNQLQTNTATQLLSNLPKARLLGSEIEVEAVPIDNLFVSVGIGIADTKITKTSTPSIVGNKLPFAEDFNANMVARYDINTRFGTVTPEISMKYRGKYYTIKENDYPLGEYTTWNARISFKSADGRYYGSVWGKNLTDKREVTTLDDSAETWGSNIAYLNARRTYGVTVGARF